MRKTRRLEMKGYDGETQYHQGKAKMVADICRKRDRSKVLISLVQLLREIEGYSLKLRL